MGLETVLVAVDEGDTDRLDALATTAVDIAGPAAATVELVRVFSETAYDDAEAGLDRPEPTPTQVAQESGALEPLERAVNEAGLSYRIHGCLSDATHGVVSLTENLSADLVLVGGSRRSPSGKVVFGSTAQELMVDAPCPVTLVKG
ncbi:universal stress protein [Halovenus sp. WSH3]|uniref:Universal stress protein n=1 Tax=Halovenus carboxidivorans TaxID=2692199 RepID=A0A6B0T9J2_9EURY|nr:universal stress protein [Halovenus carboxidivorans]MXR51911.1 universal stress protein [Halovenus carboxidivorans]